jgi:dTDP-4-dehydrorhamnose reductase
LRENHSRLIQISSDGVFSGAKGKYTEEDFPDATDIYGTAKLLGEVRESHAITIRVSIIGHELGTSTGLLEWFLSQESQCRCFTRSIFSGLPTVVLAEIIRDIVVPRSELTGIYHVAAMPISKFDLLSLVAEIYGKKIEIIPETQRVIDRSLTADKFYRQTGYSAPGWRQLVETMYSYR